MKNLFKYLFSREVNEPKGYYPWNPLCWTPMLLMIICVPIYLSCTRENNQQKKETPTTSTEVLIPVKTYITDGGYRVRFYEKDSIVWVEYCAFNSDLFYPLSEEQSAKFINANNKCKKDDEFTGSN